MNFRSSGKNFIGFDLSAEGNVLFQSFDPAEQELNPTVFYQATEDEVDRACSLAQIAFEKLQRIDRFQRADFLARIADEIMDLGDTLIQMFRKESGLTESRAIIERTRTVHQLRSFAELVRQGQWVEASIDTGDQDRQPPKPDLRKMHVGIGPVAVFGASNFPLAYSTAGGDTAAAFAAGCPVIVKAHPMHAGTGALVSEAIIRAAKVSDMPNGIFSNLNAQNFEVGKQLVLNPAIKAVGFTGSVHGGRALFDLAASRPEPIPVFAEMGSTNPIVVLPSALEAGLEKWTTAIADSIISGTGQYCTSPGMIFLQKSFESNQFVDRLAEKLMVHHAGIMLHPDIQNRFETEKKTMLEFSDRFYEKEKAQGVVGRQALMVLSANGFIENEALHHEVFGPFAMVILCQDRSGLQAAISVLKGQLTGTILGSEYEIKRNMELVEILKQRVGRIIFNGVPTGVEVCPSMNHGGPYPASTDSRYSAVGTDSVRRFVRPVVFQNCPQEILPVELRNKNHLGIIRRINGTHSSEDVN